jgi:hypothetical protein
MKEDAFVQDESPRPEKPVEMLGEVTPVYSTEVFGEFATGYVKMNDGKK